MTLHTKFKLSKSPEELRLKYAEERALRMRPEGNSQYRELRSSAEDDEDPHVAEPLQRDPIVAEHEVVIVGGGFGGMLEAAHLRKRGIDDFAIVEAAADFGGTWYWNRYPGAACDVESYVYLPLLDDTGYVPTEKYAKAPEIHHYCQLLAKHFGMYEKALFQTRVAGAEWNEKTNRWLVTTNRGDRLSARFLVIAGGILHKAKLPGIEGLDNYKGVAFHTSRWDYDYTGGGPLERMDRLADKRVGIIGTGATGVQAVPRLAEAAGQLYVFQRTPSSIGVRGNKPTDPEWAKSLKPGWQQERIDNWAAVLSGRKPDIDMIQDGWTDIYSRDGSDRASSPEELEEAAELADLERMEEVRARVDAVVKDKATAELLKPWYGHMCKRPCFHDEYLDAFNRPSVTLVDTRGRGVEKVGEKGPIIDGKEYEVDLLVFASGFEVTSEFTRRMGFDPVGPGGRHLSTVWKEDGPETLFGASVRQFPNMFVIGTIQGGGAGVNFVEMIHEGAMNIAHIIRWAIDRNADTVQPKKEAAGAWLNTIFGTLMARGKYNSQCTPGWYNNEGVLDMSMAKIAAYLGNVDDYCRMTIEWRNGGGADRDLEITPVSDTGSAEEPSEPTATASDQPRRQESNMSLDGTYETVTKSPMGDQKSTIVVKTDGASWTGSVDGSGGKAEVTNGTVDGNTLRWSMERTSPFPMTIESEATIDGDDVTGSSKAGAFGTFAMTGKRVS